MLSNVTLVCVSSVQIRRSLAALAISQSRVGFGRSLFLTHDIPRAVPRGIDVVEIDRITSIDDYNRFVLYQLWAYVETEFCLVVQADGYVLHPERWSDEFLDFDYVGAPWPLSDSAYIDPFGNHQQVGNGGFSLRSKRLLLVPTKVEVPWEVNHGSFYQHMNAGFYSEDGNICVHNRHIFEAQGCRFAPPKVAGRFSRELRVPPFTQSRTFGYHKRSPITGLRKRAPAWRGWAIGSPTRVSGVTDSPVSEIRSAKSDRGGQD